jgi:hypothetical protein
MKQVYLVALVGATAAMVGFTACDKDPDGKGKVDLTKYAKTYTSAVDVQFIGKAREEANKVHVTGGTNIILSGNDTTDFSSFPVTFTSEGKLQAEVTTLAGVTLKFDFTLTDFQEDGGHLYFKIAAGSTVDVVVSATGAPVGTFPVNSNESGLGDSGTKYQGRVEAERGLILDFYSVERKISVTGNYLSDEQIYVTISGDTATYHR